jgi:hypothetical protein
MKTALRLIPVLLLAVIVTGCMAPRVPQTVLETPFGQFKGPKDMELEIEGLQFQKGTNGAVVLTAKSIRSKSRNNPDAITASNEQIQAHWAGVKGVAGEITERAVEAATKGKP